MYLERYHVYQIPYTGPPNITTSFVTDIKNRSVKLIGNLYVYDDSPGILQTFWTKNNKRINTRESKGKLSETRTDNPSLTITNVGPDDAAEYKLIAINAVGSTTSDAIVLGSLIFHFVKYYYIIPVLPHFSVIKITCHGAANVLQT